MSQGLPAANLEDYQKEATEQGPQLVFYAQERVVVEVVDVEQTNVDDCWYPWPDVNQEGPCQHWAQERCV